MKTSLTSRMISQLLPMKLCVACHQHTENALCDVCIADLPFINMDVLKGNMLNEPSTAQSLECKFIDQLYVATEYIHPVKRLISEYKFSGKLAIEQSFSQIFHIHQRWMQRYINAQRIIPIPLSNKRLSSRLFNQAYEISKALSRLIDAPIDPVLIKHKETPQQASLDAPSRKKNMNNVFSQKRPLGSHRVVVVDDVITTGATANHACQVLKSLNPDMHITVFALAISRPHR
ncbi:phosphoribosyltransferase family protein [Aestuariibacter sp. AA17]|uniref:Phosphoribosyltransferase family protein n=1 Tax=Fluctibacter corallii TaxID=2984329 RepID=A0ABT3AAX4_9ALTE|nr:phosphoribosyltransferase family protein [Aestuariibacter sp. AA17]MCV2885829.1 phosphoribosyltransferase family protein [Aestuariibacter sp. AA17]